MAADTTDRAPRPDPGPALDETIGVYVHWPFCRSKCPYCDFNSHVSDTVDHGRWRRALVRELETQAARVGRRRVESVFFGGGTPSLMEPETVAAVLDTVTRLFRISNDLEVTLEANPTSVEAGRLDGFRAAGVNRVSLGVQALDDEVLRFLGRSHGAAEALAAVAAARDRFERVSFDLIYARPGQDPGSWRRELARALDHAAGHLSLYQLTIEPTTPFHAPARPRRLQPAGRGRRGGAVGSHPGNPGCRGPSGLRGLQPRPARRGVPAQPGLLELSRLSRRRPRRARPADRGRPQGRHPHPPGPGDLAGPCRAARPRPGRRPAPGPGRGARRSDADRPANGRWPAETALAGAVRPRPRGSVRYRNDQAAVRRRLSASWTPTGCGPPPPGAPGWTR